MTPLLAPAAGVRRSADADPTGVAIVDVGGEVWTWRRLDERVDVLAAALGTRVPPGGRVAAVLPGSAEGLAFLLGAGRAGICMVPVPERLAARERAAVLDEVRADLVVEAVGAPGVPDAGMGPRLPEVRAAEAAVADRDFALGVLTSGTGGRPKVALLTEGALLASARAWTSALPPATGWLLALGLAHVAGIGVAWRAFGAGLPIVLAPAGDTAAIARALRATPAPSHASLVPAQLVRLLEEAGGPPPATLRAVPLGGSGAAPSLVLRALRAGWPVVPTYGLSEAGSGVTALPTDEAAEHPESAGRPLPGVDVRIGRPAPDGVGDVEVRSRAVFGGYLGRPRESAAAFTDDGWLRTGDLGRLDPSGRLAVVGRRDDVVITGGENVRPAEVEAVLEEHPAVAEAAVVGLPDATWGAAVTAVIVIAGGATDPGDEALRSFCHERLAPWKVPTAFVRVEALPRTSSGKLRRAALREARQGLSRALAGKAGR